MADSGGAAGAPLVPSDALRQAPPARQAQWTYQGTSTDVHTMPTRKHFYTHEAAKEAIVASNHPCPWSQSRKEPKISGPASAHSHGKTRDMGNQWTLEHKDDSPAKHDTRGPIGHGAQLARKPEHVRRHVSHTYTTPDGRVLAYPDDHNGGTDKSASSGEAPRSPAKRKSKERPHKTAEHDATLELKWTPNSSAIGHISSASAHREFTSALRDTTPLPRGTEWVDPVSGHAADGHQHGNRSARDEQPWKEESVSAEVAPPMERPRSKHPLMDLLVATWFGSPVAAEMERDVPLIGTGDAPEPEPQPETAVHRQWDSDSDDDTGSPRRHEYPKPWQTNMSPHRQPTTHQHTFARPAPRTPRRSGNPLAHLQSELSPELSHALGGFSGKGVSGGGGGSKLKLQSPSREHWDTPDSPWKWGAEREREARQKALERRASSPGGSPVCGGAV
jgi:hypothetical protein